MFIYIMTMLLVGLTLYFGMKWILGIWRTSEKIEPVQLKADMEKVFEDYRYSYGQWGIEEFTIPSGIKRVCFVEKKINGRKAGQEFNVDSEGLCNRASEDYDPLMCDSWKTYNSQSVLFDPMQKVDASVNIGNIDVAVKGSSQHYLCIPVSDKKISVKLTGIGDAVRVELP